MAVGRRQRVKERFVNFGVNSLAEHERLEVLLYNCVLFKDTNPLARRIYDLDKNLLITLNRERDELTENNTPEYIVDYLKFSVRLYEYLKEQNQEVNFFNNINSSTKYLSKADLDEGVYLVTLKGNDMPNFILKIGKNAENVDLKLALSTKVLENKNYFLVIKVTKIYDELFNEAVHLANYLEESLFNFIDIFIIYDDGVISFSENGLIEKD